MDVILVVEDDDDVRHSLAQLLRLRGFQTVVAGDGREALDLLEAGLSPCLILLDLMLPVMSGWEFRDLQRMNPRFSGIPTVVISGVNDPKAERLQATALVTKPIDIDLLFKTVERHC